MGWRRRTGIGWRALVCAGCVASSSARAVPITVYGDVDFDANQAAARAHIRSSREAPLATSTFALELVATKSDPSTAPIEISFRDAEKLWVGTLNEVPVASDDSNR